jgi:hypothetical protein
MKVVVWIVLQNVEETFEISQFFKLWDKKISFKAYSNISASFDFFPKFQRIWVKSLKIYRKRYLTKP